MTDTNPALTPSRGVCERLAHLIEMELASSPETAGYAFALVLIDGQALQVGTSMETADFQAAMADYLHRGAS